MAAEDVHASDFRSNRVRLRTLVVLRWIAIIGQSSAIVVARWLFDLDLDLGLCFLAIGATVTANIVALLVYPENKRLTEGEIAMMLVFDIVQLGFLVGVTGGLNNPFALLMLAPVTISATTLPSRTTALLGLLTIVIVSIVANWHLPLRTSDGLVMRMPEDFVTGFWVAIVIGVLFLGVYANRVAAEIDAMSEALTAARMALAREQKLTDLGGVVAAAAHELGTPLATITLASSELIDDLEDRPELQSDARLIRDQADRCRDILRSMGRAGKSDLLTARAPLGEIVREAAEPHASRGVDLIWSVAPAADADEAQPMIERRPEIVHGLRNLIQNAVDFARTRVWIDVRWDARHVSVRIVDDGPGFRAQTLARIGDPFLGRGRSSSARPGYDGMGLGLFIAKTLLERTGAELVFANGGGKGDRSGAVVEARWPRDAFASDDGRSALGDNTPILP